MEPQTFWVKPLNEVPEQTIPLPAADQIGVRFIIPRVLCFKTDASFDADRFVAGVQAAVAALISEAPFLAGRVEYADEATSRIRIHIPADAAVEVRVRHHAQLSADALEAAHWPPHMLPFRDLCLADRGLSALNFVFGLQANLIAGGVVIVLHLNHSVVDGSTLSLLQSVFAEHLGRYLDDLPPQHPSGKIPAAALDRTLVHGSSPARALTAWRDWKPKDPAATPNARSPLLLGVWRMSPAQIERVRLAVQPPADGPAGPRISTANSVSTFLWRAVTRARGLPADATTTMLTPIQARARVAPALPAAYCGNVLVYGRAATTVGELVGAGENGSTTTLNAVGAAIDRSVKWWDSARIREYWGSIEATADLGTVAPNANRDFGTDFEVSNISNMPFWKLAWGRGLHVRAFRWPGLAVTDGWVNVLPRLPSGGFELITHLTKASLEALLRDAEFTECVEYLGSSDKAFDESVLKAAEAAVVVPVVDVKIPEKITVAVKEVDGVLTP